MNIRTLTVLALAAVLLAPSLHAQSPPTLHYQWTQGQTLRYLIQRDPYFADPKAAIETVNPDAPYQSPVVERLTEHVEAVAPDGTATLLLTLSTEPGFEVTDAPQPVITRIVKISAAGHVLSVSGAALGNSPAERDLLRGFALLPSRSSVRPDGLAVITRAEPVLVTKSTSPDHDGTLQQTTRVAQSNHLVFDTRHGWIEREINTMTVTMSLIMTKRGRRGVDDFGHVIPNIHVTQSFTIERQAN